MDEAKRKRLEAAGWSVGTADDFLGLSKEESELVDMKIALSRKLKKYRRERHVSQRDLAQKIGSSQSRVAKAEAGDPSVSTDLLIRALLSVGATPSDIGRTFSDIDSYSFGSSCEKPELVCTS